jgi:hypothetical protein
MICFWAVVVRQRVNGDNLMLRVMVLVYSLHLSFHVVCFCVNPVSAPPVIFSPGLAASYCYKAFITVAKYQTLYKVFASGYMSVYVWMQVGNYCVSKSV